jgi:hypothetical protein
MNTLFRIVVAVLIFGHGIGHVVGVMGSWTEWRVFPELPFNESPWILPGDIYMQSAVGKAFGILWLIATVGFFAAAFGLMTGQSWWSAIAVIASFASLLAVIPWWNSITPGIMSKRSAVLVDIVIIVALLGPWKDGLLARLSAG